MSVTQHNHTHSKRNNLLSKSGPARMATRQDEFRQDIERRIEDLRRAMILTVDDNDALRLLEENQGLNSPRDLVNVDPVDDFIFETDAGRHGAFVEWWNNASDEGLLDPIDLDMIQNGNHWTANHIDNAYEDGISWANPRLREEGIDVDTTDVGTIVQRPVHQDAVRELRTRTYEQLEGFTRDMSSNVGRILSDGLAEGIGPHEMARNMSGEITNLNNTRARVIARTEVMNAHSNATGKRYEEMGVTHANIVTSDPCPICEDFEADGPHTVKQVISFLPGHPNCVCAMIPVNPDDAPRDNILGKIKRYAYGVIA